MTFTEAELLVELPSVRRYALKLTRSPDRADDLVNDVVVTALRKRHLFEMDTKLGAWLRTLCHHQFVNDVRRSARAGVVDGGDALGRVSVGETSTVRIELTDVLSELDKLPRPWVRLLARAALNADRYEELAAYEGVPVGTIRSRLSRAREALRIASNGVDLSTDELGRLS